MGTDGSVGGGRSAGTVSAVETASAAWRMLTGLGSWDAALSEACCGRDSGAGTALLMTAARVRGEVAVGGVLAAALLPSAGELVALVLGAEVRGVAFADVAGLTTDRETGRAAGEAGGLVRGVAPDEEAVDEEEVTDLLAERDAGLEADAAGVRFVDAVPALLTDREAGRVGVALLAGEAACVGFAAVLLVGRVVTEREAGREVGGADLSVGGRGEEDVTDLLAEREVVCVTGGVAFTEGNRASVGMRDGSSLPASRGGMARQAFGSMKTVRLNGPAAELGTCVLV